MKKPTKTSTPAAPAPRPTAEIMLCRVLEEARFEMDNGKKNLEIWATRFAEDAQNAFEWSSDAFKQAARVRACQIITNVAEGEAKKNDEYGSVPAAAILKAVARDLREEVLRRAKWPARSTSAPSNEAELCLTSALAEWLEKVERAIERSAS